MIKVYHTKLGIYNNSEFIEDLMKNQKNVIFGEADALHQNGVAEHTIHVVFTMANKGNIVH